MVDNDKLEEKAGAFAPGERELKLHRSSPVEIDLVETPPPAERFGLRDILAIALGDRLMRRWLPRHAARPDHFFDRLGRPRHFGHRERLRERFLATWPEGLPDYELLELVLFNAVPRIDVKPLAKALLERFGDFNAVVGAPEARLLAVRGVDRKVVVQLRLMEATARRLARGALADRSVISSWDQLVAYCRTAMAWREVEHVRALYLDQKNRLIADEELWRGTVNQAPAYPREIVRRALDLGAVSVILAHNHPSGDPEPSEADVAMTRAVRNACETMGIRLHDHIVIGSATEVSMRARRLM